MANTLYNVAKLQILDQSIDLVSDTLKVMLVDSGYTFDPDHAVVDDGVSASSARLGQNELSGTGYVAGFGNAGRLTLTVKSLAQDDVNDRAEWLISNDSVWSSINAGTAAAAVIIKEITNDAASIPIAYIDTAQPNFPVPTSGADLTIIWNAEGVLQF